MANKYQPFRQKTEQIRLQLQGKAEGISKSLQIARVGTQIGFIGVTEGDQRQVIVLNGDGKIVMQQKIKEVSTELQMMGASQAVVFEGHSNLFRCWDLSTLTSYEMEREKSSEWSDSEYEIFFFYSCNLLCLVEKQKSESKLKITYYEQKEGRMNEVHETVLQDKQWSPEQSIIRVNDEGLLGWGSVTAQSIDLNLFSHEEGYAKLDVNNIFGKDGKLISIANNGSNLIHLLIQGTDAQDELPIIVIETEGGFSKINQFRAASQRQVRQSVGAVSEAWMTGDFLILRTADSGEKQVLCVYDFESESIVSQINCQRGEYFKAGPWCWQANKFTCWNCDSQRKEMAGTTYSWRIANSLSVMKLLEAHSTIQKCSKTHSNIVLIFGAHLSGKSTLRHFLGGGQLLHVQTEGGYYEVRAKGEESNRYAQQPQKNLLIETSVTEKAVLIQIPNWSHQSIFFQAQVKVLLREIFDNFKQIHSVVAISEQYVEDSARNVQVFNFVLSTIRQTEADISHAISIVLTKIEDQSALEMFTDRIEEINEENEEVGAVIKSISDNEKIYFFENREHTENQGLQMLENILNSEALTIEPEMGHKINKQLAGDDMIDFLGEIKSEAVAYFKLMDRLFTFLGHVAADYPLFFPPNYFHSQALYLSKQSNQLFAGWRQKGGSEHLVVPLYNVLGYLRLFIEKATDRSKEYVEKIVKQCTVLAAEVGKIATEQELAYVQKVIQLFVAALSLLLDLQGEKEDIPCRQAAEALKIRLRSILGQRFISIISQLTKKNDQLKSSPLMSALSLFLSKAAGASVVITKTVVMDYSQQKAFYLKQRSKLLELICSLPSNVMKLDLMIQQLIVLGRQGVNDSNMRKLRFYLRESSRVCQFHGLYKEAIIFLMVIPDFLGIDLLLDDLVEHCKAESSYENKKLFQNDEPTIINYLIILCRDSLRDSLVKKLISIKSLNVEVANKAEKSRKDLEKEQNMELSKEATINKYLDLLESKAGLPFYDLNNDIYKKMIENRAELIEKCKQYEESANSRSAFESKEAMNWLIQTLPIPQVQS